MNILGHIIRPECIQGLGPLMKELSGGTEYQLYGSYRFFFELHLTGHTTKIYSDWFYTSGQDEKTLQQNKKACSKFREGYNAAQLSVKLLITPPVPIG